MTRKTISVLPQKDYANALVRAKPGSVRVPRMIMDRGVCTACERVRMFPGPLTYFQENNENVRAIYRIVLNELPKNGAPHTWSYGGVIDPRASQKAREYARSQGHASGPVYSFSAKCPGCNPNGALQEVDLLQQELRAEQTGGSRPRHGLSACKDCGERRSGDHEISLKVEAGFVKGDCMGSITLLESDWRGWDFRPGFEKQTEHWAFHGVLDLTKGEQSHAFVWSMVCPRCVNRRMVESAQTLVLPPPGFTVQ